MNEITTADALVAVAARQGLKISLTEAAIVLGYMEGHDYCLMANEDFTAMALHDLTEEDCHDNDMAYDVRQAIEFSQEMNEELLTENSSKEEPDVSFLLELRKDELILDLMMKRAESVIPPVVRVYRVAIIEHLRKVVSVEAASWSEAEEKVKRGWENGDYILDADSFAGVMFASGG